MNAEHSDQYQDLVELDDSTLSLKDIEVIALDADVKARFEDRYGKALYTRILLTLTHEQYDADEAQALWNESRRHLMDLESKLGRNPGISVAVMDYLVNLKGKLSKPIIIEEKKSEFMSETTTKDELTQLYSRSVFDVFLKKAVAKSNRAQSRLSLLMIDIDDFKLVNDTYGHAKGDLVLTRIGAALNQAVRKMDMVARYGGEEIAIIMPGLELSQCLSIAERIREQITSIRFDAFSVTASIGIGHTGKDKTTPEKLVNDADAALYRAKHKGKNRVVVFKAG
jgi:diguanylate cyclase (GGDEF)-like protein